MSKVKSKAYHWTNRILYEYKVHTVLTLNKTPIGTHIRTTYTPLLYLLTNHPPSLLRPPGRP